MPWDEYKVDGEVLVIDCPTINPSPDEPAYTLPLQTV